MNTKINERKWEENGNAVYTRFNLMKITRKFNIAGLY